MKEKLLYEKTSLGIYQIAKIVGISPCGVWKRLKKQGVKIIPGRKLRGNHWSIKKRGKKFIGAQGYVELRGIHRREHRKIIEDKLGRKLKKGEIVHHVDENIQNNSLKNLIILSRKEHSRLHQLGKKNPKKAVWGPRKLNLIEIRQLRKKYSSGKFSQEDLAKKFKIHQTTVSTIVNNKISY